MNIFVKIYRLWNKYWREYEDWFSSLTPEQKSYFIWWNNKYFK